MSALDRGVELERGVAIRAEAQMSDFFVLPRSDITPNGAFRICIPNHEL